VNSESGEAYEKSKANDGTNKVPPIPSDSPPITDIPSRNTKNDTAKQPDWQRRHHRVQLAAVVVGAIVAVIYGCQLNEMRKATQAATDAAKSAKDSITFAKESAHLDQRAWVGILDIKFVCEVDKPLTTTVTVRNTGKTFARELQVMRYIEVLPSVMEPLFSEDNVSNWKALMANAGQSIGSVALLSPNGDFIGDVTQLIPEKISQTDLDDIKAGKLIVWSHGKIIYRDIFDCHHWTTYCIRSTKDLTFRSCDKHNDADNDRCQ
jgi:hypothetical protein